jgi:hypothetical protein
MTITFAARLEDGESADEGDAFDAAGIRGGAGLIPV